MCCRAERIFPMYGSWDTGKAGNSMGWPERPAVRHDRTPLRVPGWNRPVASRAASNPGGEYTASMHSQSTYLAYDESNLLHSLSGHPEHEGRLRTTVRLLQTTGLWERLHHVPSRQALAADLARVHSPVLLDRLAQSPAPGTTAWLDRDTYINAHSFEAARIASGGVLQVTAAVWYGEAVNGLALVRPPGHHATPDRAMGFCLLNHIAVAARWARTCAGADRILVFDFDVHHGNGTQDVFYADPGVLFVSLHQSPLYPMTGYEQETGNGPGVGTTCNLPLPAGTGDVGYRQAMERIVLPLVTDFAPQLILVSAGFDGHWQDPLANMQLSLAGYAWIVQTLRQWSEQFCEGKLVLVLEGGYQLEVLAHSVHNAVQILLHQEEFLDPFGSSGTRETDVTAWLLRLARQWGLT